MNIFKFTLFFFFALIFSSCNDDTGAPVNDDKKDNDTSFQFYENGVFILNEGNFNWGHGSIYFYDPLSKEVKENIFEKANERVVGNVLQSMTVIDGKAYLMLTNSNKIEVVDHKTMKSKAVIDNIHSPRYMQKINNEKYYVSSIFGNGIFVINNSENKISYKIETAGWTDHIILINNKVFVSNTDNNSLLVIDPQSDLVINSIELKAEPKSMQIDHLNRLWVLCTGGFSETFPALYIIDPVEETIIKEFTFPVKQDYPDKLAISSDGKTLYYINRHVYRLSVEAERLDETPFIESNGRVLNAIGVYPEKGHIYVSDAKDYVSNGIIYQYDTEGNEINSFKTGIIPGNFYF